MTEEPIDWDGIDLTVFEGQDLNREIDHSWPWIAFKWRRAWKAKYYIAPLGFLVCRKVV